jgi:hypothetical protein
VALTPPQPGLVLRYAYLWRREFHAGADKGRKDRPTVVVLATPQMDGGTKVYVLPVTHRSPDDPQLAMEVPPRVKQQLGLDGERSWIVLNEVNDFLWPGYDLRPVPGSEPMRMDYGFLPPRLFQAVRDAVLALARDQRLKRVPRE